jgi:hypothetical protein
MGRIERIVVDRVGKIQQIIQAEHQYLVNFQRDVLRIFAEHRKLRGEVYSMTIVPAEMYQQFNSNIKVTFLALKATFNAINVKELAINGMLQAEILQITMTI